MKVVPKKSENQSLGSVPPTSIPEASAPSSVGTPESSNTQEDGILYLCGFLFLCMCCTIHCGLPH